MGNIVLLDDLTINKIAAGEVIERPASVIKEMVENSIDAGANNITVEIKNGGISLIRIIDNGKGIASDDLEIAFERHATSKIRTADDLNSIKSMGFRGEALASIAAIANVEMISKTADQETGYKIVVEGGDILEKQEVGCQTGTAITVKNLFFNTPVRYKFLKKDYTEAGYIEDVITRIALIYPNIAIKLINSGKTVIQTNGNGDMKSVIYSIYGRDVANGILQVNYTYEDVVITGVIGKPEIARSNRSNQIFFVNNRYIKDKTLSAATEQAYKGLIPIGKFGFAVLNIEINPSKVDVNVHPAKLEVRFEDEGKIFQSIYHSIKDTLLKSELVADTDKQEVKAESQGLFDFRKNDIEKIEKYNDEESKIKTNINTNINSNINAELQVSKESNEINNEQTKLISTADVLEKLKDMQNEEKTDEGISEKDQIEKLEAQEKAIEEIPQNFDDMYEKLFGKKPIISNNEDINDETLKYEQTNDSKDTEQNEVKEEVKEEQKEIYDEAKTENNQPINFIENNISVFEESEEYKKTPYKFIGIVFNTYIILEIDKEMYMLDQHAAHERILYEKVKKNYYSNETNDSQLLLLPDVITLTHKEMEVARENMDMFRKVGFCIEEFGENTIKLTGIPTICIDLDTKEVFLETLDEINNMSRTSKQEKEERFIATVACKAAVKAGMVLSVEEVNSLMDKLFKLPNPFTCPHGRPTAIKMTKYEIERKFARK